MVSLSRGGGGQPAQVEGFGCSRLSLVGKAQAVVGGGRGAAAGEVGGAFDAPPRVLADLGLLLNQQCS